MKSPELRRFERIYKQLICGTVQDIVYDKTQLSEQEFADESGFPVKVIRQLLKNDTYGISLKTLVRRLKPTFIKYNAWNETLEELHKQLWGTGATQSKKRLNIKL